MEAFFSVSARRTYPCLFAHVSDESKALCCGELMAQWVRGCRGDGGETARSDNDPRCEELQLKLKALCASERGSDRCASER